MPYDLLMTTTPTPRPNLLLVDEIRSRQLPPRPRRKEIRLAVGATIREVAQACEVSYFSVAAWEDPDGTVEPRPKHRIAYRKVLDDLEALARELAVVQK